MKTALQKVTKLRELQQELARLYKGIYSIGDAAMDALLHEIQLLENDLDVIDYYLLHEEKRNQGL